MTTKTLDKRSHLISLVKDFDAGMLATRTTKGIIRGRPMGFAEVQEDGDIYFCAGLDSPKVEEIRADPHVAVFLQGKTKWASISGTARIVTDRVEIRRLWSESWKIWFPEGKEDPNLCLIAFDAVEGEYWDNSGVTGVHFVLEAAKAYITGTQPGTAKPEQNAKVRL